jgi:hypothetical protein
MVLTAQLLDLTAALELPRALVGRKGGKIHVIDMVPGSIAIASLQ